MESASSHSKRVAVNVICQLVSACDLIMEWNKDVISSDSYVCSPEGMQKMAASCMLIETIGESIKKIDRLLPGFLMEISPDIPWRSIMELRNHIAHGYFNLDAEIIYDVAVNEIPGLKAEFIRILSVDFFSM